MDTTSTAFESDLMKHADNHNDQMRKQLEALHQTLRTVRHGINNHVAVIMAMAELTQRNPAQCAKLAQICLEKAPQISAAMGGFSELFDGTLSLQEEFQNHSGTR
jgi:predicted phage gp36 major capsid-like protein